MTSAPPRGTHFEYRGWSLDRGTTRLRFAYYCDVYGIFEEEVTFPGAPEDLSALSANGGCPLFHLLGVALGVSYYKLAAAPVIDLPALPPAGRKMAEALYTEGLAEFYVRNGLPYPADLAFRSDSAESRNGTPLGPGPALVAFGGGKDSYVARAIIQAAGDTVDLTSVVLAESVEAVIASTAPKRPLFIQRRLSPRLYEVAADAFTGHVPITAINMMILAIAALLTGRTQVIFANERSADEPTMVLPDGTRANHQYSKSSAFEALLRDALAAAHPAPPLVYSLLRPFSELWIGKVFASLTEAHERFISCNRNFRIAGNGRVGWCGECAKCAFTSLILAPFITRDHATEIFGTDFLDREELQPFYEQLLGLSDQKPWDCVGTIDECRAALWKAGGADAFRESRAVQTFLPKILKEAGEPALARAWDDAFEHAASDVIPERYLQSAEQLGR